MSNFIVNDEGDVEPRIAQCCMSNGVSQQTELVVDCSNDGIYYVLLPLGTDPVSLFPSTYNSMRFTSLSIPSESVPLNEFCCKYNWVNGNGPDSR
jgi:hypothetical protein